jgi:hypothetical protein
MNSGSLLVTFVVLAVSLSALFIVSAVDQANAVKRIYDAPLSGENEVHDVQ